MIVFLVRICDDDRLLHRGWVVAINAVAVGVLPNRADKLVLVVLTNVPNIHAAQIKLISSYQLSFTHIQNVQTAQCAHSKILILIHSTNRPYTANLREPRLQ